MTEGGHGSEVSHGSDHTVDGEDTTSDQQTRKKENLRPWASVLGKIAAGPGKGLDLCRDDGDGPARKKRRTISI
jgi:hypothetical protein